MDARSSVMHDSCQHIYGSRHNFFHHFISFNQMEGNDIRLLVKRIPRWKSPRGRRRRVAFRGRKWMRWIINDLNMRRMECSRSLSAGRAAGSNCDWHQPGETGGSAMDAGGENLIPLFIICASCSF